MTVKELKVFMAQLPDDAIVVAHSGGLGYVAVRPEIGKAVRDDKGWLEIEYGQGTTHGQELIDVLVLK